jgi:hypothetical protein
VITNSDGIEVANEAGMATGETQFDGTLAVLGAEMY